MKIIPSWLREFVEIPVDDRKLAEDLTMAGISIESIEGEGAQTVFDVDFTPNRVDAMNHYGVARDCAAVYDKDLKPIAPKLPGSAAKGGSSGSPGEAPGPTKSSFKVEIEDPQGCARYAARVLRGVKIAASPEKIARRLELVDSRPINNVADASNYTLQEIGHPTHCFDLNRLEGGKIVVRRARPGEKLKTLDGVERTLHPDDLIIADAVRPVGLAGVMGGFDSMIMEHTRDVLIESAWFDPGSVRRTARRHGMHTDASHRFERGADFGDAAIACARVAQLILETAGGQLEGGEIDVFPRPLARPTLELRHSEVRRILGQDIEDKEIARILGRLGFGVTAKGADFVVQVPSWRLDVEREIDLIEEIARIYGYDRFPNTLPAFSGTVVELPDAAKDAHLREALLALGYHEAISLSFVSKTEAAAFSPATPVEIANPISEEASVMRTSMVPSMLGMLAYNLNRGSSDVRLFEAGNVYEAAGARTAEHRRICVGATGAAVAAGVHGPARPCTFFDIKGDLETLLAAFQHQSLYFDAHAADNFHPGRSARAVMDGTTVASLGQLHPRIAEERKLRQEVYLAELDLERLYRHELAKIRYRPIPRFPAVERDFSFVFDDGVTFERVQNAVMELQLAELRRLEPAEVFRGGAIAAGRYSMLVRATFQSSERTLRDDEVASWSSQIIKALAALGGTLRA